MQPKNDFTIRTMISSEMNFAIDLAKKEGWNPGLFDAECFYQTDPSGFLIGILDNLPIGCISAVSYGHKFGFIGFYIVKPEFRGHGYGIRLWQAAIKRLAGQNTGLDGVIAQESNYIKSGFQRAYRNIRFESHFPGLPEPLRPEIVKLQRIPFNAIAQYDRQCFPVERPQFLHCWFSSPSSVRLGYLVHNQLKGYGVIRKCYSGYKIGPLFADNPEIADQLYSQLALEAKEGAPFFLDVPEANPEALSMVKKYNMKEVFATTRMYSQGKPDMALEKIYGVTTFELG
jgi:GNAT superfamily N-acetyltransferase